MTVGRTLPKGYHQLSWQQRLQILAQAADLSTPQLDALLEGRALLGAQGADRMVENVVGVMGLPLAIATGMVVDGVPALTPMVVEEPSIVAALSASAKVIGQCGGFATHMDESLLAGQIQLTHVRDGDLAVAALRAHKEALLHTARALQPAMVARGGGAQDVTVTLARGGRQAMVVVQVWVDTCDAMGANAVNSLCEALAPEVARVAGDGRIGLRILSNLCSRSLVTARCTLPVHKLAHKDLSGEFVRDQVVLASAMAEQDMYRAVTHNKGIMNGIDGVALATGNDWRAIEAGAHAWAGRGAGYVPLSHWQTNADGALEGTLCLPLKVGIVGGNFLANPTVALSLQLLQPQSAQGLARHMAAVGLGQNFAALKALGTVGIQSGHMALHARSVVASAGARPEHYAQAVQQLLACGDIKLERARSIVAELEEGDAAQPDLAALRTPHSAGAPAANDDVGPMVWAEGYGKLIVLGEHAVVYRSHALAVPLMLATQVGIAKRATLPPSLELRIPQWGVHARVNADGQPLDAGDSVQSAKHQRLVDSICLIVRELGLSGESLVMTVKSEVPRAMGLGSSAALAVATARALSLACGLNLSEQAIIDVAFLAEKLAHGTPSGVDNALATLGAPLLFQRGDQAPKLAPQKVHSALFWVVGLSHEESLTATTVGAVRAAHDACPELYDSLFAQIDALTLEAAHCMGTGDVVQLGRLMNINHGLLHALGVSTRAIEQLIFTAREHGALGAKVTGGGGGGSMLTLCQDEAMQKRVVAAFERAGFRALMATTEVSS